MVGIYENIYGYPFTGKIAESMVKVCWMEYKAFKAEKSYFNKINVVAWYNHYVKKNAVYGGLTRVGNILIKKVEII